MPVTHAALLEALFAVILSLKEITQAIMYVCHVSGTMANTWSGVGLAQLFRAWLDRAAAILWIKRDGSRHRDSVCRQTAN